MTTSVTDDLGLGPATDVDSEMVDIEQVSGWLYRNGMTNAASVLRGQVDVWNARIASLEAALRSQGKVVAFRINGGRGPWMWVDGTPPDDAHDLLAEGEWIELAYGSPIASGLPKGLRARLMGLLAESWVHGKSEADLGIEADRIISDLTAIIGEGD